MHSVGRTWAAEHHLTIEQLQKVEPRSNDPGCSAGFGMGLVMYLGPKIIATGGKSVLPSCVHLPTQYRRYTCVHSLGHALMRGYHETLFLAVNACGKLGARFAPDCAQGAFHDYWIALRGADETTSPVHAVRSARALCAGIRASRSAAGTATSSSSCRRRTSRPARTSSGRAEGLAGAQRDGCIGGASLALASDPSEQTRLYSRLVRRRRVPCLHEVAVQATGGKPAVQRRLIGECRAFPATAGGGGGAGWGVPPNPRPDGPFGGVFPRLAWGERAARPGGGAALHRADRHVLLGEGIFPGLTGERVFV